MTSFKKIAHRWKSGMLLVSVDTYVYHTSHRRTWESKMHEASIDLQLCQFKSESTKEKEEEFREKYNQCPLMLVIS